VFAGERERKMLLGTLVGLGAYLGITAIFESVGPHALVFPHYIIEVDEALAEARADGPFQSSVAEGIANFACGTAATIAFFQWQGWLKRSAAAFVVAVCAFGCFLTLERGVWLAAVVAILVVGLATRSGRRWLVPGVMIGAIALVGALVIFPALEQKASSRANDQLSVWDRENQAIAGANMVEAKPLLGFGWDRYESDSIGYFRQTKDYPLVGYSSSEKPLPLHDIYLSYAVELGLVGAVLWLCVLLWGVGSAIFVRSSAELRPWKMGLLAFAVFFIVVGVFNPDQAPFPTLLLWAWAGVALGSAPLASQAQRVGLASRRRGGIAQPKRAASLG
jgi:O-antigen ligase